MSNIIRFKARVEPRTVGILLEQASEAHISIHRLMAEARLTYGTKSETFNYVQEMLAGIEGFINNSSRYLEAVEDIQADFNIAGNFTLEQVEEKIRKLSARAKVLREKQLRRVVAFPMENKEA